MTKVRETNYSNLKNFGIEIECYNVNKPAFIRECAVRGIEVHDEMYNHITRPHWKIVTDGSVTGIGAVEVVSPVLNGKDGLEQVQKISDALDAVNAKINKSCGLHVHHESGHLTEKQLTNLVKFYARCEEVVDSFMPRSRRGSNNYYCKSCYKAWESMESTYFTLERFDRYHKLNLASYYRQGTIEFRHHSGTTEAAKIIPWILFTANFLHEAKNRKSLTKKRIEKKHIWRYLKMQFTKEASFFKARQKHFAAA